MEGLIMMMMVESSNDVLGVASAGGVGYENIHYSIFYIPMTPTDSPP